MSESIQVTDERRQELRERYLLERDKRLRADGNDQYLEPTGRFEGITDDPYTPVVERETVHDDVTVAIIGAGFSGLVTGAALEKAGLRTYDCSMRLATLEECGIGTDTPELCAIQPR